jgi:hypothetical protein
MAAVKRRPQRRVTRDSRGYERNRSRPGRPVRQRFIQGLCARVRRACGQDNPARDTGYLAISSARREASLPAGGVMTRAPLLRCRKIGRPARKSCSCKPR